MDADHSNAFAVGKAMGSPETVEGDDFRKLEAAGKLAQVDDSEIAIDGGALRLDLVLPRQGVSLIRIEGR